MKILYALVGGASALFLAMGVARFAFTPVLPLMQNDFHFTDTVSGALASVNYLGYLLGSLYAIHLSMRRYAYGFYLLSIPLSLALVALMWLPSYSLWYGLRFASGFLSAIVFIMSAEFIMDYLGRNEKLQFAGVIYSGIGGGMALSGLTVPFLSGYFNSSQIWLWLAGLSIIPGFLAMHAMPKPEIKPRQKQTHSRSVNKKIYLLSAAYLLEGLGYIITGTFISVMVLRGTGSVMLSGYVWVIAGLGAVFITPLWPIYAKKAGLSNTLMLAFALQTVSIAAPVMSQNIAVTMIGAIGYGGTFLGIVSLSLAYGRQLSPGGRTTSVLTVFFSIGQITGPLIAGYMADKTGGFDIPVLMASAATAAGGVLIYILKKGDRHANT